MQEKEIILRTKGGCGVDRRNIQTKVIETDQNPEALVRTQVFEPSRTSEASTLI